MNPLTDILSPLARRRLYVIFSLVGVGIGAVQVAYASVSGAQPTALTVAIALYAYLGVALGLTAASNVTVPPVEVDLALGEGGD